MDINMIKKIFPFSFTEKKDVTAFVIALLIHIGAGAVVGGVIGMLSHLPLIGWLIALVGGIIDLYIIAGIVFTVLDYMKIIK